MTRYDKVSTDDVIAVSHRCARLFTNKACFCHRINQIVEFVFPWLTSKFSAAKGFLKNSFRAEKIATDKRFCRTNRKWIVSTFEDWPRGYEFRLRGAKTILLMTESCVTVLLLFFLFHQRLLKLQCYKTDTLWKSFATKMFVKWLARPSVCFPLPCLCTLLVRYRERSKEETTAKKARPVIFVNRVTLVPFEIETLDKW